nr:metallothionein expression activator [Quercus suber]
MLPTNSTSSVQSRRNQHRRQQSLEVPIIANPSAAHSRRGQQGLRGHRRGLSLDQSLTALSQPSKSRPLHPQNLLTPTGQAGSPPVRIPLDSTNPGRLPTNTQHYQIKQETQQQSIAQPGYQAQDFQSHLQQQLNGVIHPSSTPTLQQPIPTLPHQQHALQELQHHLDWYRKMYGASPNTNVVARPFLDGQSAGTQIPLRTHVMPVTMQLNTIQTQQQPIHNVFQSQVSHKPQVHTVPNTPQPYTQGWPSPPSSTSKHVRSHSFQLDVAPLPDLMHTDFAQSGVSFADTTGYASSSYSSSHVDPASPGRQAEHMPTLFEECGMLHEHQISHLEPPANLLLSATEGPHDFNDPDFDFGASHITAVVPRQALLNQLGPDIPASIVETGVQNFEVQQYIGDFDEIDKKYPCMYHGCTKRFGRKENVRAHVQTHLGDRQFKCDLCDKTFVRQHDLKRHITIHSDDRPHGCICGQSFARHDALTRHRQRGMCVGTLPGFEKDPADLPKRGRPKKQRPEMGERVEKAVKTRKYNKKKANETTENELPQVQQNYASSNYTASDRSFPVTPPDTSDAFDADAFLNMAEVNQHAPSPVWRDTPPTSPATGISPGMLSQKTPNDYYEDWSSPAEFSMNNNELGPINAQPDPIEDIFSPPGESMTDSSVYGWSDNDLPFEHNDINARPHDSFAPSAVFDRNDEMTNDLSKAGKTLADVLDQWLADN